MELKHLGEIKVGDASVDVYWVYSENPEKLNVRVLGREKISVGVSSGEKDIAGELVRRFFAGKEALAEELAGKRVVVAFSEKVSSASLAHSDRVKGLPYKSVTAVIGVEEV